PETNETVEQVPTAITRQYAVTNPRKGGFSLHTITIASGEDRQTLEVTPNHFLWVKRGEEEFWMPASDVLAEDFLLTGTGQKKDWVRVVSNARLDNVPEDLNAEWTKTGGVAVYNVSFGEAEQKRLWRNFAVCTAGGQCVVAHNKQL
ncbi:MAG: hypothetical protein Q7S68_03090, partial [Deltaproteobacteria bacterium]|nr:hypothetical protein [Deltaproteobacteria bacterium]